MNKVTRSHVKVDVQNDRALSTLSKISSSPGNVREMSYETLTKSLVSHITPYFFSIFDCMAGFFQTELLVNQLPSLVSRMTVLPALHTIFQSCSKTE